MKRPAFLLVRLEERPSKATKRLLEVNRSHEDQSRPLKWALSAGRSHVSWTRDLSLEPFRVDCRPFYRSFHFFFFHRRSWRAHWGLLLTSDLIFKSLGSVKKHQTWVAEKPKMSHEKFQSKVYDSYCLQCLGTYAFKPLCPQFAKSSRVAVFLQWLHYIPVQFWQPILEHLYEK